MENGQPHDLLPNAKSAALESKTIFRYTAAVTKIINLRGWRFRISPHMGKVQTTSPSAPQRQMITAFVRCRAHWTSSHTIKGAHPRASCLKRKNRRHHGLSAECSGPGKIETTNCRR